MDTSTNLDLWRIPMLQNFESTATPEELLRTPPVLPDPIDAARFNDESLSCTLLHENVPLSNAGRSRRRQYTDAKWNEFRIIISKLYIDQGMIMRDVVQELKDKHDFHPTVQMCKNRIRTWGISKNIKAEEKGDALEQLEQGCSPTAIYQRIPPEKLVRYMKSRSKKTAHHGRPNKVVKPNTRFAQVLRHLPHSNTNSQIASSVADRMTRSLALPSDLADTELFLRAIKTLVLSRDADLLEARLSFREIDILLVNGIGLWTANAFPAARSTFSQAAEIVERELKQGIALDVRIAYWISPKSWWSCCQSLFQGFRRFMVRAASEHLVAEHPLRLVVQHLQKTENHHDPLQMWNCILDNSNVNYCARHWWRLARRRWQYCSQLGRYDLAAAYCQDAMTLMRQLNHLSVRMEVDVLLELGNIYLRLRQHDAAKSNLERMLKLAQADMPRFWRKVSYALFHLVDIHRSDVKLDHALATFEKAFQVAHEFGGLTAPETIDYLTDLLRFCHRRGLHGEIIRIKEQYPGAHDYLEKVTEGLWNVDLDDDSSEAGLKPAVPYPKQTSMLPNMKPAQTFPQSTVPPLATKLQLTPLGSNQTMMWEW